MMNKMIFIFSLSLFMLGGCKTDLQSGDKRSKDSASERVYVDPDFNGDGVLNILVLGTNSSFNGSDPFSPDQTSQELLNIFSSDAEINIDVNVVAQDIHNSASVTVGLGGNGAEYTYTHHSHSLTQYYYWPQDNENRMKFLMGEGELDWDYVVIAADPYIVSTAPGYYALGVNKIAKKVDAGGAKPLLLMVWPKGASNDLI